MNKFEVTLVWANGEREETCMFADSLEQAKADALSMMVYEEEIVNVLFATIDY